MMCVHFEKNVFTSVNNLAELKAHEYPGLGYLVVSGILPNLPAIEKLDMSLKMQLWVENFHQYYNTKHRNSDCVDRGLAACPQWYWLGYRDHLFVWVYGKLQYPPFLQFRSLLCPCPFAWNWMYLAAN